MIKRAIKTVFLALFYLLVAPLVVLITVFMPKKRKKLIWGTVPLINNKYWSKAVKGIGYESETLMDGFYSINKKEDYDVYFDDITPAWIFPSKFRMSAGKIFAFFYVIRNASVLHICFLGGPLWNTWIWWMEAFLYRLAGIKIVVLPYGGDVFKYSQIMDPTVRHGLLLSYPQAARSEAFVSRRVDYWTRNADVIVMGFTIDGIGRWDAPVGNMVCIDTEEWRTGRTYTAADGINGAVKILHAPNHRGVKGTEFLLKAIEELKAEGLKLELILLEKVPNERVKGLMSEVDIVADQFVLPGYGIMAIESMSMGLPVMVNLDNEAYTKLFRRYSFLDECPLLSTTPETVKANLRALVSTPELREALGRAGRDYVEKYHSYAASQYLFGAVYEKVLEGKEVDLMNLFHPLKSEYGKRKPAVRHPLVNSRLK